MSDTEGVGLVVFLKNEVHDVAGWLAWHIALGFDTIFVFDDGSTDGTEQVVRSAALSFDIRYKKVNQGVDDYYQRQQTEYGRILAASRGKLAWLCFLDSDEYLLLKKDESVSGFLSRYPDAHGVAVNWRLYGSNWQVLRPLVPAPAAYMRHSNARESINRHVKSFVRPDRQDGLYNVHAFRVEADRYLNTDGKPVRWSSTTGIVHDEVLWDMALIMHFQCRSMQHFMERAERRRDQPIDARAWTNEEWNKEEDHSPSRFFGRMFEILARIELENSNGLCRHIEALRTGAHIGTNGQSPSVLTQAPGSGRASSGNEAGSFRFFFAKTRRPADRRSCLPQALPTGKSILNVFTLRSCFGTALCVDTATNLLSHVNAEAGGDLRPIFLVTSTSDRSMVLLVRGTETRMPLRVNGGRQGATVLALELDKLAGGQITLRAPVTRLFLTAEPAAPGGRGLTTINRHVAQEWEMFRLADADTSELDTSVRLRSEAYFALLAGDLTVESIADWLSTHQTSTTSPLLQDILRRISKFERTRLCSLLAGAIASELLAGSQYS